MTMTEQDTTPRIYVASLSDYNAGILHGVWIEAATTPDEINEQVQEMLAASPTGNAEEWAIHDYDNFAGLNLGQWATFEQVSLMAYAIEEHGAAFAAWADNIGAGYVDADTWEDDFTEAFQGEWDSLADYASELFKDTSSPEAIEMSERWPFSCIDWQHAGRELELGGDIWTADAGGGCVYVFRNV